MVCDNEKGHEMCKRFLSKGIEELVMNERRSEAWVELRGLFFQ